MHPPNDTNYTNCEKSNPAIRSFDLSIAESNPGVTPTMATLFDALTLAATCLALRRHRG